MERDLLPPLNAALVLLRRQAGLTEAELAARSGFSARTISRYERGKGDLTEKKLLTLVESLGLTRADMEVTVAAASVVGLKPPEPAHPLAPSAGDAKRIEAESFRIGLAVAGMVAADMRVAHSRALAENDRAEAAAFVAELQELEFAERKARIEASPEDRTWALVPALGDTSERSAAHGIKEADEWAELALLATETACVPEDWRPRLRAYALAFKANVQRVANRLREADARFDLVWAAWRESLAEGLPLGEWRLLELEASLRCDQRSWGAAIELVERAISLAPPEESPKLRLKLARFFNDMNEPSQALETLTAIRNSIELKGDARLLWVMHFHFAVSLLALGRAHEAELHAAAAGNLAREGRWELQILRSDWLGGKVAWGCDHAGIARLTFREVRQQFVARKLPLDAALVGLDEARLLLEAGAHSEVCELSREIFPVLRVGELSGEALTSLQVFWTAAAREQATVALALKTIQTLRALPAVSNFQHPA